MLQLVKGYGEKRPGMFDPAELMWRKIKARGGGIFMTID
jgi:hypothetical protein